MGWDRVYGSAEVHITRARPRGEGMTLRVYPEYRVGRAVGPKKGAKGEVGKGG